MHKNRSNSKMSNTNAKKNKMADVFQNDRIKTKIIRPNLLLLLGKKGKRFRIDDIKHFELCSVTKVSMFQMQCDFNQISNVIISI